MIFLGLFKLNRIFSSNIRLNHQALSFPASRLYTNIITKSRANVPLKVHDYSIVISKPSALYCVTNFNSTRGIMTSPEREATLRKKYKPRECRFPTPYGHIAGLVWGQPDAPHKILCVHGWLDNAGSFERLIPFILDHGNNYQNYHIVAIDLPGVGLSSHRPPGSNYTTFSMISEMRRVTLQLQWDKIILLSHSLGSSYSFLYSCVFQEQVIAFISLDLSHPITHQVRSWNVNVRNSIEEGFKCDSNHQDDPTTNIQVPVYSEQDAIKRLMEGHSNSLTRESAEVLLKRGAKKQRWGYTFSRDTRLRFLSAEFRPPDEMMLEYLDKPFRPRLLILRASNSPYYRPESLRLKFYELYQRNCPIFRDVMLDGTHHFHMNNPDVVAPEINKFLAEAVEKDPQLYIDKSKL